MESVAAYNRDAWDREVESGNCWTVPVTTEQIESARKGEWSVLLTECKPMPRNWMPADLHGVDLLCLASGGGQQGPIFAAAGANVTVFDNSPRQLERDRMVAQRDGLSIQTVLGSMTDLSCFPDASFDIIFHPVSNVFIPDVNPVWRECFRVLRPGGALLAGFDQPIVHSLDYKDGVYFVRFKMPYSDLTDISPQERNERYGVDTPLEFGHMFTDQIGGQLRAGFHLVDLYEDYEKNEPLKDFMPAYMATRAIKPISA